MTHTNDEVSTLKNIWRWRQWKKAIARSRYQVKFRSVGGDDALNQLCHGTYLVHHRAKIRLELVDNVLSKRSFNVGFRRDIERGYRLVPLFQCSSQTIEGQDQLQSFWSRYQLGDRNGVSRHSLNSLFGLTWLTRGPHRWKNKPDRPECISQVNELGREVVNHSRGNCQVLLLATLQRENDRPVSCYGSEPTAHTCKNSNGDCPGFPSRCTSLIGPPAGAHGVQKFHSPTPNSIGPHSAMPSKACSVSVTLATVQPPRDLRTRLREDT